MNVSFKVNTESESDLNLNRQVKNIDTKESNKRNNQNSKSKETQMTGQHEPLWKQR